MSWEERVDGESCGQPRREVTGTVPKRLRMSLAITGHGRCMRGIASMPLSTVIVSDRFWLSIF